MRQDYDDPDTRYVTIVTIADQAELMVVKSILVEEGIPFIVKNERVSDLVEPGRLGTGFNLVLGAPEVQVRSEDAPYAREVLKIEEDPGSEGRADRLERKLRADFVFGFIAFLCGGGLVYLFTPNRWDTETAIVASVIGGLFMVLFGFKAFRKRRTPVDDEDETKIL